VLIPLHSTLISSGVRCDDVNDLASVRGASDLKARSRSRRDDGRGRTNRSSAPDMDETAVAKSVKPFRTIVKIFIARPSAQDGPRRQLTADCRIVREPVIENVGEDDRAMS